MRKSKRGKCFDVYTHVLMFVTDSVLWYEEIKFNSLL